MVHRVDLETVPKKNSASLSSIVSKSVWSFALSSASTRTYTNNVSVNGARHTILNFDVEFRKSVIWNIRGVFDISNSRRFNNVSHVESLDSFILWNTATAVIASNIVAVAATIIGTSVISSLNNHGETERKKKKTPC